VSVTDLLHPYLWTHAISLRAMSTPEAEFKWDFPIEATDEYTWESLAVTLYFARPLSTPQEEELRRLVVAWYDVGSFGGYGPSSAGNGVLHFMSDVLVKRDESEPRVEWWVDMGSATRIALSALLLCLQNWSSETEAGLSRVVLGYHDDFTAE
jgi:hypothetical protein